MIHPHETRLVPLTLTLLFSFEFPGQALPKSGSHLAAKTPFLQLHPGRRRNHQTQARSHGCVNFMIAPHVRPSIYPSILPLSTLAGSTRHFTLHRRFRYLCRNLFCLSKRPCPHMVPMRRFKSIITSIVLCNPNRQPGRLMNNCQGLSFNKRTFYSL